MIEFGTVVDFTPIPAPENTEALIYTVPQVDPRDDILLPPVSPVEVQAESLRHRIVRKVSKIAGAAVLSGALFASAVYEANVPEYWPNTTSEMCGEDYRDSVPNSMREVREEVADTQFSLTDEQITRTAKAIDAASSHSDLDAAMNRVFGLYNMTYNHNKLPDFKMAGIDIPDNLMMTGMTKVSLEQSKKDALETLFQFKEQTKRKMEVLAALQRTQFYFLHGFYQGPGSATGITTSFSDTPLKQPVIVINPEVFTLESMINKEIVNKCGARLFKENTVLNFATIDDMTKRGKSILLNVDPSIEHASRYMIFDFTWEAPATQARRDDPTYECSGGTDDNKDLILRAQNGKDNLIVRANKDASNNSDTRAQYTFGIDTSSEVDADSIEAEVVQKIEDRVGHDNFLFSVDNYRMGSEIGVRCVTMTEAVK